MLRRTVLLALVLLGLAAPGATAAGLAATQRVLAREMAASGSAAGAYVIDLDSGAPLYSDDPDVQRIPASVNKLFTTATALERFGPDRTLQTEVLAQTAPDLAGASTCAAAAIRPSARPTPVRSRAAWPRRGSARSPAV